MLSYGLIESGFVQLVVAEQRFFIFRFRNQLLAYSFSILGDMFIVILVCIDDLFEHILALFGQIIQLCSHCHLFIGPIFSYLWSGYIMI
jgi:hypothetical protein